MITERWLTIVVRIIIILTITIIVVVVVAVKGSVFTPQQA